MSIAPLLHEQLVVRQRLGRPRIIMNRDNTAPYLSRFYLRGRPRMPDGSEPFDEAGNPYPQAIWPKGWSAMVHRFHESDAPGALHNHPWEWGASLILAGGYCEHRRVGDGVVLQDFLAGDHNVLRQDTFHRVELHGDECWTLFVTGAKVDDWGFWLPDDDDEVVPWRQYLARMRGGKRAVQA